MFTARIEANQLAERLDAEYFTPEFVTADEQIRRVADRFGSLNGASFFHEA